MSSTPRTVEDFDAALRELDGDALPSTRWEHRYYELDAVLRAADLEGTVPPGDVLRLRDELGEVWRRIHAPRLAGPA
jgi:hypothetical protein